MGGRPSRESRRRWPRRVRPGVIEIVGNLGIGVKVPRPSVDRVEGATDDSIVAIVAVEAPNVESVDDPREAGALAKCAVKAAWAAQAGWGVEGDGLVVAEPHGEVCDICLLLLQPRREVTVSRDERVSFVDQVAREGPGEEPLVRKFPSGLLHRWGPSDGSVVEQLIDELMLRHKFLRRSCVEI